MNEEEKKAIEVLSGKRNETTWNDTIRQIKRKEITDVVVTRQKYIKTILNLIEKLQKENEKLKNIELKSKGGAIKISLEGILSLENKIKQLEKENFDLKDRLSWRIIYCQELEKDLFENCENFVISKDRVKEQIKKYAKLSDDFYSKWKKLSPFNEDYKNLKDKCMCCDAIVDVLQKLLKG